MMHMASQERIKYPLRLSATFAIFATYSIGKLEKRTEILAISLSQLTIETKDTRLNYILSTWY